MDTVTSGAAPSFLHSNWNLHLFLKMDFPLNLKYLTREKLEFSTIFPYLINEKFQKNREIEEKIASVVVSLFIS